MKKLLLVLVCLIPAACAESMGLDEIELIDAASAQLPPFMDARMLVFVPAADEEVYYSNAMLMYTQEGVVPVVRATAANPDIVSDIRVAYVSEYSRNTSGARRMSWTIIVSFRPVKPGQTDITAIQLGSALPTSRSSFKVISEKP